MIVIVFVVNLTSTGLISAAKSVVRANEAMTTLDKCIQRSQKADFSKTGLYLGKTKTKQKTGKLSYLQSNALKSNVLGKNTFLQVICYLTYPSTTDRSNFAERTSTYVFCLLSIYLFFIRPHFLLFFHLSVAYDAIAVEEVKLLFVLVSIVSFVFSFPKVTLSITK